MSSNILKQGHTCPWWICKAFDNPLRKLIHDPKQILGAYIKPGDTVLDVGCGMGYFTLGLADLVGPDGQVIAADLQIQMLNSLHKRAERAGLMARIQLHQCHPDQIGILDQVDFALAFWMVHEVQDQAAFLGEIFALLKPGGQLLIVEPKLHVSAKALQQAVSQARAIGFQVRERPQVHISRAVLLGK